MTNDQRQKKAKDILSHLLITHGVRKETCYITGNQFFYVRPDIEEAKALGACIRVPAENLWTLINGCVDSGASNITQRYKFQDYEVRDEESIESSNRVDEVNYIGEAGIYLELWRESPILRVACKGIIEREEFK